jgi:hypothetical protein
VIVAFVTVLVVTAVGVMGQQADAMLGDAGPRSSNAIGQDAASAVPTVRGAVQRT